MELDLETFLTTLYVITDDLYEKVVLPKLPTAGGAESNLSDSEVLARYQVSLSFGKRFAMIHAGTL